MSKPTTVLTTYSSGIFRNFKKFNNNLNLFYSLFQDIISKEKITNINKNMIDKITNLIIGWRLTSKEYPSKVIMKGDFSRRRSIGTKCNNFSIFKGL